MASATSLRSLRDSPFDLLCELERRSRSKRRGRAAEGEGGEWIGIAMRSGNDRLLVPREEVREILEFPAVTRVPGARSWVRGITNVRGQLLPVADLLAFRDEGETPDGRSCRLVVVNHPDIPAGVLVDEVSGFRRFAAGEFEAQESGEAGLDALRVGRCGSGSEILPVVSLVRLVESPRFADMAA